MVTLPCKSRSSIMPYKKHLANALAGRRESPNGKKCQLFRYRELVYRISGSKFCRGLKSVFVPSWKNILAKLAITSLR